MYIIGAFVIVDELPLYSFITSLRKIAFTKGGLFEKTKIYDGGFEFSSRSYQVFTRTLRSVFKNMF